MTTLLSSDQKGKQRASGHKSAYYLSVCRPAVLFTCQVNGVFDRGTVAVPFDNGDGDGDDPFGPIRIGQTVKVVIDGITYEQRLADFTAGGTSPNKTGTITFDNNNIPWENDAEMMIYEFFEPRIISPTFDPLTGVSTKRNLIFSSALTLNPWPQVRMGIHRAGFVEGGSIVFDLDGEGLPRDPEATITDYLWEISEGAGIASPTSQNTTLTISTPGQYWLYLTVTDSNGREFTGQRHIWVHDPDPENANYPYVNFTASNPSVSLDGGMRLSITVFGVADFDEFIDNALIVLWQESWYGSSKETISLIPQDYGVLFTGYIVKDSIQYDSEHGTVTFEAHSVIDVMKQLSMQALSIHAETLVEYWFQLFPEATVTDMLWWLLYWHSTLPNITDWYFPESDLFKKLFKFNEGGLYNQVRDLASKLPAVVACDKAGRLFVEESIQHLGTADRAAVEVVSEITSEDWREVVVIVRKARKDVSQVYLSGFYYDGGALIQPICSIAPTKIREGQGGGKLSIEGMILENQAHANRLSGRYLAIANNEIEEIRVRFAGNYSVLDVVPQRWWTLTLAETDTPRGISFTDRRLLPKTVNFQLDPENGLTLVDAIFESEALGPDGIETMCPTEGIQTGGAGNVTILWPEGAGGSLSGPPALLAFSSIKRLDEGAEAWLELETSSNLHGTVDPFWKAKGYTVKPDDAICWLAKEGAVNRFETFKPLFPRRPTTAPPNPWSDSPAPVADGVTYQQVEGNLYLMNWHYALASWQNSGNEWRGWLAYTQDDGLTWTWATLYDGVTLPDEVIPIWMAHNQEHVLVTVWETTGSGQLALLVFNGSLTFEEKFSLGAATIEEFEAETYTAFPVTVPDDPDLWFIAGRMQDPQAVADPAHIIKTVDAGDNWVSVVTDWELNRCVALEVKAAVGGERAYYALKG